MAVGGAIRLQLAQDQQHYNTYVHKTNQHLSLCTPFPAGSLKKDGSVVPGITLVHFSMFAKKQE